MTGDASCPVKEAAALTSIPHQWHYITIILTGPVCMYPEVVKEIANTPQPRDHSFT